MPAQPTNAGSTVVRTRRLPRPLRPHRPLHHPAGRHLIEDLVAQWKERQTSNLRVGGSNPPEVAKLCLVAISKERTMRVDYKVGDTVVRKETELDWYWKKRCREEGLKPDDLLTVNSLDISVTFVEKRGSWEAQKFEKATDLSSLSDWI
jgi:hypothetical protein